MPPNQPTDRMTMVPAITIGPGQLEFVAMDMLEPPSKMPNNKQFVLLVTNHYLKLTRAIEVCKATALSFAPVAIDISINLYKNIRHAFGDRWNEG